VWQNLLIQFPLPYHFRLPIQDVQRPSLLIIISKTSYEEAFAARLTSFYYPTDD